ncbi:unnamed protein product [Rhizoctonia solani]|uniref:F-box domain-containing protein n=1 Tax=Rhizoctonia solani TaxID=456999 RepID=A0A8H2WE72_9AGAM|nr:unnamed protein product [Rhizoctonia solani]
MSVADQTGYLPCPQGMIPSMRSELVDLTTICGTSIKTEEKPEDTASRNLAPRKRIRCENSLQDALPLYSPLYKMFRDLPLELLLEIALYLRPLDLIRLSRVDKTLRRLLMRRAAIGIWRTVLRNVDALPPSPAEISEPLLASLLFLAECTICGGYTDENVDFALRVKPCLECRKTNIIPAASTKISKFLFKANAKGSAFLPHLGILNPIDCFLTAGASLKLSGVCLRRDYETMESKHDALQATGDIQALRQWTRDRLEIVQDRCKNSTILSKWFKAWVKKRRAKQSPQMSRRERRKLANARVEDVMCRMVKMGYQRSEVQSLKTSEARRWRTWMANYSNLPDEEAWELLLPHLLHHLEENRKRRRRLERQDTVNTVLSEMQNGLESISCVQLQSDLEKWTLISVTTILNFFKSFMDPGRPGSNVFIPSFPHGEDVPKRCHELQATIDAKTPKETFELEIRTKNDELEHAVHVWRNELELKLLSLLPLDTRSVEIETPEYKLILGDDWDAKSLNHLPVENAKLLRADSIFSTGYFGPVLRRNGEGLMYYPECFQGQFKMCDKENLCYHSPAAKIAKALLCAMGLPDVSYLAINTIPRIYECGRCNNKPTFSGWKELLHHYLNEAYENEIATRNQRADTCIFMHDVDGVHPEQPLVRLLDAPVHSPASSVAPESDPTFLCLLCYTEPPVLAELDMKCHAQSMHDIYEPIKGLHYYTPPWTSW